MASTSSATMQDSPIHQAPVYVGDPLFFDPLKPGVDRFKSDLIIGKRPCESWEMFQHGAASNNHIGCAHEPFSFHLTSPGCFCAHQVEKKQISGVSPQAVPSIQDVSHKRRHSMPPAIDDIILGMGSSGTTLPHSQDDFIPMAPIISEQASHRRKWFGRSFQEHVIVSRSSQVVAVRSHQEYSHVVSPDKELITAINSQLCGNSSQPCNASLLSSSDYEPETETETSLHDSANSTIESPAHTVLNIRPSSSPDESIEPLLNRPRLTETFLVIASQAALTLLTMKSGNTSSLSANAEILVSSAAVCNIIGFLCCIFGILVCGRKPGVAARITTGIGYIATVYGFVAVMGMLLRDNLRLRITGAACIVSFPGLAYVFLK